MPSTPYAKTTITGLTALTTYQFRVSLTDKNGEGAWSQALELPRPLIPDAGGRPPGLPPFPTHPQLTGTGPVLRTPSSATI